MSLPLEPLGRTFGAILHPSERMSQLSEAGADVAELFRQCRCLMFRGFNATVDDFQRLTAAFTLDFQTYQGGGFTVGPFSRSTVGGNKTLLTATGKTQEFALPLHGEVYYLGQPPDLIWFYCDRAVSGGGETTVGDGFKIYRDLSESTARKFAERGIRYQRRLAPGDWQAAFQTEDRGTVEAFCKTQGLALAWDADGSAITHFQSSALRADASGNLAFINSLVLLGLAELAILNGQAAAALPEAKALKPDFVVRWDDGSPIEPEILREVSKACYRNEAAVSWRTGDILMVDNRSVMHGRRASSGRDRQILVRMGSLNPQATAA